MKADNRKVSSAEEHALETYVLHDELELFI